MRTLLQTIVLTRIAWSNWRTHLGSSLVIVLGMACVVGVLASSLAMYDGLLRMFKAGGDASRAIVLSAKNQHEEGDDLLPADVATILDAPGIGIAADHKPAADPEVRLWIRPPAGIYWQNISVEGVGRQGIAMRSQVKIAAGRWFKPGLHELLIGRSIQRMLGMGIGDTVPMPGGGDWRVVGIFTSDQDSLESQLVGDATTLMASMKALGYGSVLVSLKSPDAFPAFRQWLTSNPTLSVTAERQADYYIRIGGPYSSYLWAFALFVGLVMSIGALFGSINILYSVVRSRQLEIATYRALGYRAVPVAASVVTEAMLLALIGAVLGTTLAWLVIDGHELISGWGVFRQFVSTRIAVFGLLWAAALAFFGALPAAVRAATLPVAEALRAN